MNVHLYICVQILHFVEDGFLGATTLRIPNRSILEPWRGVVQPDGIQSREGGTLPWVLQTEGNDRLLVGIVATIINCEIIMYDFLGQSAYTD